MNLASVSSQEENDRLEKHINAIGKICWYATAFILSTHEEQKSYLFFGSIFEGLGNEHFWTSGTDLADEGNFFWMANGRPITFTNWNAGEPNNFRYENGEEENCLELWNRDSKGLKWNDSPCSFETYFVCEVWMWCESSKPRRSNRNKQLNWTKPFIFKYRFLFGDWNEIILIISNIKNIDFKSFNLKFYFFRHVIERNTMYSII